MAIVLPLDAVGQILQHVEEQSDVLSVALCSKSLYSVTVPQHLHYRDIRTRLNNPSLWALLSRTEDLRAPYVRSLTILPDQEEDFHRYNYSLIHHDFRERLPPECTPAEKIPHLYSLDEAQLAETYRRSENALVFALKRMIRLKRFRWYHVPQPFLHGEDSIWTMLQSLGTVKEVDVYDRGTDSIHPPFSIVFSNTFHHFKGLTTLTVRVDRCLDAPYTSRIPTDLESMILRDLPDLNYLTLSFGMTDESNTSIDKTLTLARWPKLRGLRLHGVYCRASTLARFLMVHSTLEELALAKMTPTSFQWISFAALLPGDALPNLRRLECTSYQAVALLKSPHPALETLHGFELCDMVEESTINFPFVDGWEDDELGQSHAYYAVLAEQPSPWKSAMLHCLKSQQHIIRLQLSCIQSPQEVEELATVAPQIKEIELNLENPEVMAGVPVAEWHRLYALFPQLEVIHSSQQMWNSEKVEESELVERVDMQVQGLVTVCPRLRVVFGIPSDKKAVILREGRKEGVKSGRIRWVWRDTRDSEEVFAKTREQVYGQAGE